ncbi:MAG: hypothetical protein KME44_01335, partial [Candidatus Thiodiazotropha sp. (ex Lucina pensylvanica)]|nr:hypothetical protein [Candidatus Thiodiazotropha sp. (ex Lucina pensylvanica)]
ANGVLLIQLGASIVQGAALPHRMVSLLVYWWGRAPPYGLIKFCNEVLLAFICGFYYDLQFLLA